MYLASLKCVYIVTNITTLFIETSIISYDQTLNGAKENHNVSLTFNILLIPKL